MSRYNRGEWAELYTLAKILGEGHLICQLSEKKTVLEVTGVTRTTKSETLRYTIESAKISLNGEMLRVTQRDLLLHCSTLQNDLTAERDKTGAFASAAGEKLANELRISSIKAESKTKSDIQITVSDSSTKEQITNGYSIKLVGGNDASIVNASDHTRFTYEVAGIAPVLALSPEFQIRGEPAKVIARIHDSGGWLKFRRWASDAYVENLSFVDTTMPLILAEALYQSYFCGRGRGIKKMAEVLSKQASPPNGDHLFALHTKSGALSRFSTGKRKQQWLEHKLKDFLVAHATSMNPSVPWDGEIAVTGGILFVDTATGTIVNNPVYDLNRFKQILFNGCAFDSPSTTKFNYGFVYHGPDGTPLFDLVLAVRGQ